MRLQVSRGLWRLWLVCSILWIAGWSVVFYPRYINPPQWASGHAPVGVGDQYKPCVGATNLDELNKQLQCMFDIDRREVIQTAVLLMLGVPAFVFVLGWAAIWVGRGFVRTPTQ
jgi:hypothetical protein